MQPKWCIFKHFLHIFINQICLFFSVLNTLKEKIRSISLSPNLIMVQSFNSYDLYSSH